MNTFCLALFVGMVAVAHASVLGLGGAVLTGPAGTVVGTGLGGVAVGGIGIGGLVSQDVAQKALELSVPAGSGLEGQWIPDINEKLYDDGAYRPLLHGL